MASSQDKTTEALSSEQLLTEASEKSKALKAFQTDMTNLTARALVTAINEDNPDKILQLSGLLNDIDLELNEVLSALYKHMSKNK